MSLSFSNLALVQETHVRYRCVDQMPLGVQTSRKGPAWQSLPDIQWVLQRNWKLQGIPFAILVLRKKLDALKGRQLEGVEFRFLRKHHEKNSRDVVLKDPYFLLLSR